MNLETLAKAASQALEGVEQAPEGLPCPLAYALLTRGGSIHTVLNDRFAPLMDTLGREKDTTVACVLAMWKDGSLDLPSYAFRTALRRLDPLNNAAELCLGPVYKPLSATMYHPRYDLLALKEHPELLDAMVDWFHRKWGIPEEAYRKSMEDCVNTGGPTPRWYVVMDGNAIIGGLGVIENDFHLRRDLAPNVCAVYVEEEYRRQGVAGWLLNHVCSQYQAMGIDTLYLATEHTAFYERYGWEFYCLAQEEDGRRMTRIYRHTAK